MTIDEAIKELEQIKLWRGGNVELTGWRNGRLCNVELVFTTRKHALAGTQEEVIIVETKEERKA